MKIFAQVSLLPAWITLKLMTWSENAHTYSKESMATIINGLRIKLQNVSQQRVKYVTGRPRDTEGLSTVIGAEWILGFAIQNKGTVSFLLLHCSFSSKSHYQFPLWKQFCFPHHQHIATFDLLLFIPRPYLLLIWLQIPIPRKDSPNETFQQRWFHVTLELSWFFLEAGYEKHGTIFCFCPTEERNLNGAHISWVISNRNWH